MHELTITKNIFDIVHKHAQRHQVKRVISITLEIGALSDLQAIWLQRYFDHLSRGSIVEGARLNILNVPARFRCRRCDQSFTIDSLLEEALICPICRSSEIILLSGREYLVKNMEVE